MKYILNDNIELCGFDKLPYSLWDTRRGKHCFYSKRQYEILMDCDGETEIDVDALDENDAGFIRQLKADEIISENVDGKVLKPRQHYKYYDNRYRDNVQMSITGDCNYRCKHCFMSAPDAKFGIPSKEEIFDWVDQVAECGIHQIGITGGEPLIRKDFEEIVRYMVSKEVLPVTLYTNGALVNEKLFDLFEELHVRPSIAISYDGVGWHDWLRGIDGAEEMAIRAIKMAIRRGFKVGPAMCIHKKNIGSIRETVNKLAELGCESIKFSRALDEGCWHEHNDLSLSNEEALQVYYDYLDYYKEDGMPLGISMEGAFAYTTIGNYPFIPADKLIPEPNGSEKFQGLSVCIAMRKSLYISPEGTVIPCMGLIDTSIADKFENIKDKKLKDILKDSYYLDCSSCRVCDIIKHNEKCAKCKYIESCIGGCRAAACKSSDDFLGIDEEICEFYLNGWYDKFREKCALFDNHKEEV